MKKKKLALTFPSKVETLEAISKAETTDKVYSNKIIEQNLKAEEAYLEGETIPLEILPDIVVLDEGYLYTVNID
jgi:hypothetical protein